MKNENDILELLLLEDENVIELIEQGIEDYKSDGASFQELIKTLLFTINKVIELRNGETK